MKQTHEIVQTVERPEARERRGRTLLVCPDNDPEARMILLLAGKMGMAVLRSTQMHGATLEKEPQLIERVMAAHKGEVWIVEIPGPELEEKLREQKLDVHLVDHHTYGSLLRNVDPTSGARQPSSLEQFLTMAGITDAELIDWGYDPKTVRGLGIFDDRFVQGLRDANYTQAEIAAVIDQGTKFSKEMNPAFGEIQAAAEKDWEAREDWHGAILVRSNFPRDVRGAIGHLGIREGLDLKTLIVASCGGRKIYVHQLTPEVMERFRAEVPMLNTFTFGANRCWGYDCKEGAPTLKLEDVLGALERAGLK